jgi:hypothetical protein
LTRISSAKNPRGKYFSQSAMLLITLVVILV